METDNKFAVMPASLFSTFGQVHWLVTIKSVIPVKGKGYTTIGGWDSWTSFIPGMSQACPISDFNYII